MPNADIKGIFYPPHTCKTTSILMGKDENDLEPQAAEKNLAPLDSRLHWWKASADFTYRGSWALNVQKQITNIVTEWPCIWIYIWWGLVPSCYSFIKIHHLCIWHRFLRVIASSWRRRGCNKGPLSRASEIFTRCFSLLWIRMLLSFVKKAKCSNLRDFFFDLRIHLWAIWLYSSSIPFMPTSE